MKKLILNIVLIIVLMGFICSCNKDTTSPVIIILGANPAFICVDAVYQDEGATATDDEDGDITSKIETTNNVDTLEPGSYTVKYTVEDKEGNRTEAIRTVNVDYCK